MQGGTRILEHQEVKMWIIMAVIIGMAFGGAIILNEILTEDEEKTGPITIVDDLDRTVTLDDTADRIVSLSSSNTEILFAIDAGDKVVGRDEYSDYPEEALDIPTVGGFSTPNIEKILGVDPDLIIADPIAQDAIFSIENTITTLYFESKSVDDLLSVIDKIGSVTGKESEAENLIDDMQTRMEAITDITDDFTSAEKPSVYIEVFEGLWTVGSSSHINNLISMAGGINIFDDQDDDYFIANEEVIIDRKPDVIVLYGEMGSYAATIDEVKNRGWGVIPAVENDQIYVIDGDLLDPCPRIVDGIEYLAYYFHPDLFSEPQAMMGLASILASISLNSL